VKLILVDQDAARKNADRTFHDAHVLVENHVPYARAVKQGLDRRNQDRIGCANELPHVQLHNCLLGTGPLAVETFAAKLHGAKSFPCKSFPCKSSLSKSSPAKRSTKSSTESVDIRSPYDHVEMAAMSRWIML
jgi:hypothetical protein